MALKIFRAVWFLSVMAVLARLLFGYAGWQEELVIQETAGEQLVMNKEALFYVVVAALVIINVVVYLVGKVYSRDEALRTWIHALITSINIFFIVGISLIGTYNSSEKFNYSGIDFIIYGSVSLILLVALVWPVYVLCQKIFVKQAV
jgi:TctA family transporter